MTRPLAAAVSLALAVALAPLPTRAAAPSPEAAAQAELEAGLQAYQRGDYERAIERFRRAYELHESPQFLYAWAQAARGAGDCATAIELYRRFIDAGATGDSKIAAEQNEARCREQLKEAAAEPSPPAAPEATPAGPEAPAPAPEPDATRLDPPPSRDRPDPAGLALLVTGSAAALAGVGVLVVSGVRRARQSDTSQYDRFDELDRQIDRLDIAGGITLGVGAALLVGGAIRLALVRRQRRAVARTTLLAPALGAGGAPMLVLTIAPSWRRPRETRRR